MWRIRTQNRVWLKATILMTHLRTCSPDRFLNVWANLVKRNVCLCHCRLNTKTLLHARMHRRYVYVGKQYRALSFCAGLCLGHIDSEKALVPKLPPFTQLLLIRRREPFNPSLSVCSLFLSTISSSFFHDGGRWAIPTENYSESLSTAPSQSVPPSLCLLLRGPFPSSSPSGAARKERSVMALWRENGGIHPMLWRW